MISYQKFISLMKDLEMMFFPLSKGQEDIYYDRLKHFDDRTLEEAIKYLYDTHTYKRFPLIAEIRDAANQAMREAERPTAQDLDDREGLFTCHACGGVGSKVEYREIGTYSHVVQIFCQCPKGQKLKAGREEYFRQRRAHART